MLPALTTPMKYLSWRKFIETPISSFNDHSRLSGRAPLRTAALEGETDRPEQRKHHDLCQQSEQEADDDVDDRLYQGHLPGLHYGFCSPTSDSNAWRACARREACHAGQHSTCSQACVPGTVPKGTTEFSVSTLPHQAHLPAREGAG